MNNIYKVIWSKAKNCYVVASEIARSHTKSASGSKKIGGVARHALLALGAACAIACGGFVNVGAADTVEAQLAGGSTATVYTKEGTELYVADQIRYLTTDGDALTNKNNIAALQTTTTDQGQKIATNTANIANNAAAIAKKIDTETAEVKLALKANAAEVYTKTDADGKFATSDALNTAKTDLDGKIAANTTKITAHETAITDLKNKAGTTDATVNNLSGRMAAAESDIDGLQADMSTAQSNIGTLKTKDTELSGRIDTEINNRITSDTALDNKIDVEINNRIISDTALDNKIDKEIQDRDAADAALEGKITTLDGKVTTDIADLKAKDTELEGKIQTNADNIQTNKNDIAATNKRTSGIEYDNVRDETTIEGRVTVNSIGDVTARGQLTAQGGVNAGNSDIITTGEVNAGSLNVENASHLKGDVTMDNNLTVRGDTSLKGTTVDGKLTVTDDAALKNTEVGGTLTTTGKATFQEAVEMDKGLTVTGDTKLKATNVDGKLTAGDADLKNTQVGGTLNVTGDTTLDGALTAKGEAKFEKNVTVEKDLTVNGKLNVGEIYMEHNKLESTGKQHNSATSITADGISNLAKVTEHGNTTESQFTHNEKGSFNYAKDGNTTDWKESTSNVTADGVKTEAKDSKGNRTNTSQTAEGIKGYATDKDGYKTYTKVTAKENSFQVQDKDGKNKNHQVNTLDKSVTEITNADGKTTKTEQTALDITNTAKDGTITNDAKDIVNNASGNMTNTVGGDLTTTVSGNELHEVTGTKTENVTGKVTENYGNGQETNVTGDQNIYVTGNQTTTVTGDISNKAENITNEANTKLTDKVGDHTRVLDSDGITDTVGGSTFKQRIDKIMMESKDVSIKAEETLTNEAKVITNKASEVINNEAVNINNTATGIITSKASEIKNQADKLISNKVGENTWENMENGKITTSIKDGAKQNLTQSDAASTTQSTVDGGKSTVTIQNADGLADAVTDGTNTSVQNQTASAIAAAVKDGAGNENASVANATTSVNTIKSGSKANTVISTADGTSFINSEAAAPVGDGTEVKTTIKGNTITTGKVTMDYAEVMKDLGVRGNANITGKTTTGSLEVTGTSTLKGDVTMESNATVKKDLNVEGITTTKTLKVTENAEVDGTLKVAKKATFEDSVAIAKDLTVGGNATITGDVTAKSYKVGDKTYISADGINANDQKITNVADGSISEGSKDAVNGGQLYGMKTDLEHKVDKVGANAAAMANLHPMEFDPDSKWNIAAAMGNYGSETATAIGAFYRPNEDVMVNFSTAFGTGENMVGGGVSVRLGKGSNKLSREESNALKAQVNDLTARMDALLSVLNPNMSKDFPDVPENHWAYEAVSRLAGNDIVQGYPDGEFHGERTMTRYEMAEIIYNALSRGAEAEKELVEEFKPELQAMAASEKATAEKAEG